MKGSGQFHISATLSPEQEPQVPAELRSWWSPKPVWQLWKGEIFIRNGNRTTIRRLFI